MKVVDVRIVLDTDQYRRTDGSLHELDGHYLVHHVLGDENDGDILAAAVLVNNGAGHLVPVPRTDTELRKTWLYPHPDNKADYDAAEAAINTGIVPTSQ